MIDALKRAYDILKNSIVNFVNDDCYTKASALTYYVLLSIVPVLAVLFGIAKGFGFEGPLKSEISQRFAEQPEVVEKLIQFACSWLQNVQGGLIAGIGTILLLWTVLGLLNSIEGALNAIWKVKLGRPYHWRLSNYLATIIMAPLFLVTVSSLNVYLSHTAQSPDQNFWMGAVSPFLLFLIKLSPYLLSWILFTFIYQFMPNTKVDFKVSLIAGILAGTAFQIWQWVYIQFQVMATSYGIVYGSFAALPLFLIWLQTSWLILLAGAELAVEIENNDYLSGHHLTKISRKVAALLITYKSVEAFSKGIPPYTTRQLVQALGFSFQEVQRLIDILHRAGVLSAVLLSSNTVGYQPGKDLHSLTMKDVWDAVESEDQIDAYLSDSPELLKIQATLKTADEALRESPGINRTFL